MKNIIINKRQEQLLAEAIQENHVLSKISNKLKHDIDVDNTPLSNLPISHKSNKNAIGKLLVDSYLKAKNNFSDDIESFSIDTIINKLDKLVAICQKKEEGIHNELEKLCADVATSFFNIDNLADVTLECKLVNDLLGDEFHVESNLPNDNSLDDKESALLYNNRKIANTLVFGGALSLYNKLQDSFISQLFKLDEDLPHLYSKILKINEYLMFVCDNEISDSHNYQTGCVKVILGGDDGDKIISVGTLFPFLLIETLRGYLELMSDNMLPESELDSNKIIETTDVLVDEPWYMILGKNLWQKIVGDNNVLPIVSELFNGDNETFNKILTSVVLNNNDTEILVKTLWDKATYNDEYNMFLKDLKRKRDENNLLIDGEE